MPPSANVTPCTDCMRRVASISSATFSSSGTVNGSSFMGLRHEPVTGSTGDELDGIAGQAGGGPRGLDGGGGRVVDLGLVQARRGGEAPPPVHEDPDAQARGVGAVDALHLLVAHGDGLGEVGADAGIGIVGARLHCGLDRRPGDVQHLEPPSMHARRGPAGTGGDDASYPSAALPHRDGDTAPPVA